MLGSGLGRLLGRPARLGRPFLGLSRPPEGAQGPPKSDPSGPKMGVHEHRLLESVSRPFFMPILARPFPQNRENLVGNVVPGAFSAVLVP